MSEKKVHRLAQIHRLRNTSCCAELSQLICNGRIQVQRRQHALAFESSHGYSHTLIVNDILATMTRKVKPVLIRFVDSPVLRQLATPGKRWKGKQVPCSNDPEWQKLRSETQTRQDDLIKALAAEFQIKYHPRTRKFWLTLSLCLLNLFPATRIERETRGRASIDKVGDELFREIERATDKQAATILRVAQREGLVAATLERRFRRWRGSGRKA
jgi:hypothetical protein